MTVLSTSLETLLSYSANSFYWSPLVVCASTSPTGFVVHRVDIAVPWLAQRMIYAAPILGTSNLPTSLVTQNVLWNSKMASVYLDQDDNITWGLMLKNLCTFTASLHNLMQELRVRAPDSTLDVNTVFQTRGRRDVMDADCFCPRGNALQEKPCRR